jgi:VanZ family protein
MVSRRRPGWQQSVQPGDHGHTASRPVHAIVRAPAPLALMALIFVLSHQPDLNTGLGIWDTIGRKIAHAGIYGGLTLLWTWTLRSQVGRPHLAAVAICLAYAISDEYHQSFVEGRSGSPLDVAIDGVGIAAAVTLLNRWAAARTG